MKMQEDVLISPFRVGMAVFSLNLLFSGFAVADHTEEHRLQTIEVTAPEETGESLTTPSAETAKYKLSQVPGATTFIHSEEYRSRPTPGGVADVLSYSPGVFSQSRYGNSETRILVRGAGTSLTFGSAGLRYLRDGLPLTGTDGFTNPELLEPMNALYTEVYRGSNALQYGSAFLGGAVNFVSRNGRNTPGIHTTFVTGSHDYYRPQLMVGGVLNEDLDYFVSYTGTYNNSFRDHSEEDISRGYANFGYRWNEDQETRVHLFASKNQLQLPGSLSFEQYYDDPYQAQNGLSPGSFFNKFETLDVQRNLETLRGDVRHTIKFTPDDVLTVGAWYENRRLWHPLSPFNSFNRNSPCRGTPDSEGIVTINNPACGGLLIDYGNLAGSFNRNRQQDAGLSWRFTHDGSLFGSRNSFVLGGFFGWGKSYGTVDNTLPGAEIGTKLNNAKSEAFNIEIFGEDRFALTSSLDLVVGGQFIHAKRRSLTDFFVPTSQIGNAFETDASRWYTAFSPKVGLLWQATEKQQFFANFSRSYEPPTNTQLAFRDPRLNQTSSESALDAQEGTTIEVGTRGEAGVFNWDLAVYHSWINNEILSTLLPGQTQTSTNNADKTTHTGVEVGTGALIPLDLMGDDLLRVRLTYTYQRFLYDNDSAYGDNYIPGAPNHFGGAEAVYEHPSGFYIGPNIRMTSNYYVDYANTLKAPAYTLFGARAGYKNTFNKLGYHVFVEGRNLTDEKWVASTSVADRATRSGTAILNPGFDRTIFGGISIDY
ncbi:MULTISPECIES: TonB-dependent receptor family protein [Methylocaldum]|jgi:iron complex outermembrane receptor protein|uniref:TonB-dependent receptor family protein n=1 Tax=unclassified Methylocaldum TaxID=2622260 RepID=UPI000989EF72|nr:TonB-dependent receptor [Methylocaldum sp. 14B]MVF20638.1 TonB-dependent receptor [Methylocaldum sp. BRCS4]